MYKHKKLAKLAPQTNQYSLEGAESSFKMSRKYVTKGKQSKTKTGAKAAIKDQDQDRDSEITQENQECDQQMSDAAVKEVFKDLICQDNRLSIAVTPKTKKTLDSPENSSCQKENNILFKLGSPYKQTSAEGHLQMMIIGMLTDIKQQTAYLVEKQAELEYLVKREIKPSIVSGFAKMKQQINKLESNPAETRRTAKRKAVLTQRQKRYLQSEQHHVKVEEDKEDNRLLTFNNNEGAESTFMRKLDITGQAIQMNTSDEMNMSLGANLLKVMRFPIIQQSRQHRNFNFRCNLEEIDKIMEEDNGAINECQSSQLEESLQKEQAPLLEDIQQEKLSEINTSIEHEESQKKLDEVELKRPSTGRKQPRKLWGTNNINFAAQTPQNIVVDQVTKKLPAQFGIGGGVRIKRITSSKQEIEDPILALLLQEALDQEQAKILPEQLQPSITSQKQDKEAIEVVTTPRQARGIQIKRGIFKAPPPNLIESLLMEDSPVSPQRKHNLVIKVNNFLKDKSPDNRSPLHMRKVSPMVRKQQINIGGISIEHSDEEEMGSSANKENPFDSSCTHPSDHQEKMRNLFFHQKSEGKTGGDTAEFGK